MSLYRPALGLRWHRNYRNGPRLQTKYGCSTQTAGARLGTTVTPARFGSKSFASPEEDRVILVLLQGPTPARNHPFED